MLRFLIVFWLGLLLWLFYKEEKCLLLIKIQPGMGTGDGSGNGGYFCRSAVA